MACLKGGGPICAIKIGIRVHIIEYLGSVRRLQIFNPADVQPTGRHDPCGSSAAAVAGGDDVRGRLRAASAAGGPQFGALRWRRNAPGIDPAGNMAAAWQSRARSRGRGGPVPERRARPAVRARRRRRRNRHRGGRWARRWQLAPEMYGAQRLELEDLGDRLPLKSRVELCCVQASRCVSCAVSCSGAC